MKAALLVALLAQVVCAPPAAAPAPAEQPPATPTPRVLARATASATPTPEPTAEPVAGPPERVGYGGAALLLDAQVPLRISGLIEASRARAALVVADGLSGRMLHEVAADEVVFAASLYKLGVLLEAERRLEEGTLRSTDRVTIVASDQRDGTGYTPTGATITIEQALERMITLSDNPSALALVRLLGTEPIHATLAREGIVGQYFSSRGSVTTARAVGTFFGELVRGGLVSPAASEQMLARLARQRVNDRIPAALPEGAVLAHKTGNLGFATHDAGIISGPGGTPVVLVILTWGSSESKGAELIRGIAAAVYAGLTLP